MLNGNHSWRVLLNYACICGIWGSTFLAIKYALDGIPPLVVTSARYLLASVVLWGISCLRGEARLTSASMRLAGASGLLLTLGNALVCYSETQLPTGLVAVVMGSLPAWIILLNWQCFGGAAPRLLQVLGIAVSLLGVAALSTQQLLFLGATSASVWWALFASIAIWAIGTLTQRQGRQQGTVFAFSALQCALGGSILTAFSAARGEFAFPLAEVPASAIFAMLYLALVGTVVASTAYVWLSQNADPQLVSTYSLITPVVAVGLGWVAAGEVVTWASLGSSLLVVAGVAAIVVRIQSPGIRVFREASLALQVAGTQNRLRGPFWRARPINRVDSHSEVS